MYGFRLWNPLVRVLWGLRSSPYPFTRPKPENRKKRVQILAGREACSGSDHLQSKQPPVKQNFNWNSKRAIWNLQDFDPPTRHGRNGSVLRRCASPCLVCKHTVVQVHKWTIKKREERTQNLHLSFVSVSLFFFIYVTNYEKEKYNFIFISHLKNTNQIYMIYILYIC